MNDVYNEHFELLQRRENETHVLAKKAVVVYCDKDLLKILVQ